MTVTADVLHTVTATDELIHQQGGQFVLPVKQNRQSLFDALNALPWADGWSNATSPTTPAGNSPQPPNSASPARHTPDQASPAQLAAYNRGHWAVESLHFIRDTCYREDQSTVRTRSGPRVLASLRNLAINALRLASRPDITEATRWAARNMTRPFTILNQNMIMKRP